MILLLIGLLMLVAIHLVPAAPMVRAWMVERFGELTYRFLFSVVSIIAVILLAVGMGQAEYVPLWDPVPFGRELSPLLMAVAVLLVVAAYLPTNLTRLVKHPMLWGVILWAVAHLLVAGHLAALLLFGGLGAYSLFAIYSGEKRGRRAPFGREATVEARIWYWDALTVAIAAVFYLALLWAHPWLFGVAVM